MRLETSRPIGDHLREWRQRRRLSQLELACDAEVSSRHLSFVETGRSLPSRDMILRLADQLEVPLRERNVLLVSAGYAPVFSERSLEDPTLRPARDALDLILRGLDPYPAIVVDRHWSLVAANEAAPKLLVVADAELLRPPVNVMRLSLHPRGLAPRIVNLAEWRSHLLDRLRRQIEVSGDPVLVELLKELSAFPTPEGDEAGRPATEYGGIAVPLQFRTDHGVLSFFSTTTVFGTPIEITLSELALESFFPADAATAAALRADA